LQYKSVAYVIEWIYSKYLYCHTECWRHCHWSLCIRNVICWPGDKTYLWKYSKTPFICFNWDSEPSRYAENPDNWLFLWK